ncbi:hypothetical protein RQP46_004383 [Phenoliferia psychrophenolica]
MSSASSRGSSPDLPFQEDPEATARLEQLEKLLQASLGYSTDAPAEDNELEEPPKKKRKKGKGLLATVEPVGPLAPAAKVDEEEVVAFRLFSTQKTPQAVVIREKEGWDPVADPRIRDATEESKEVLKQRMRDIASIAVDGTSLKANAALEPLSVHAGRATPRKLTSRTSLPTLAYLNAVLPPPIAPPPPPSRPLTSQGKGKTLVKSSGVRREQPVRRPLERLANVKLEINAKFPSADDFATKLHPSIEGKVVLLTGPSLGGIGFEAARVIAKHGASLVILAGRSQVKLDEAYAAIQADAPSAKLRTLLIDLCDLTSVRRAAETVMSYEERIDVLLNNAGFATITYVPTPDTAGQTESIFTGNHLGPFLFTNLIRSKLSPDARIVNVSSATHVPFPLQFDDLNFADGKSFNHWPAYGQSKTANVLFTISIGKKWPGIEAFAVNPGAVPTNSLREIPFKEQVAFGIKDSDGAWTCEAVGGPRTLGQGASGYIVAAFDPELKGKAFSSHN